MLALSSGIEPGISAQISGNYLLNKWGRHGLALICKRLINLLTEQLYPQWKQLLLWPVSTSYGVTSRFDLVLGRTYLVSRIADGHGNLCHTGTNIGFRRLPVHFGVSRYSRYGLCDRTSSPSSGSALLDV